MAVEDTNVVGILPMRQWHTMSDYYYYELTTVLFQWRNEFLIASDCHKGVVVLSLSYGVELNMHQLDPCSLI